MSTAREREAKTIKKDIGGNASLTPAINAQGLSSFSYARPGEVGYDRYAGAGLRQLAANLSSIEPSIAHAHMKLFNAYSRGQVRRLPVRRGKPRADQEYGGVASGVRERRAYAST